MTILIAMCVKWSKTEQNGTEQRFRFDIAKQKLWKSKIEILRTKTDYNVYYRWQRIFLHMYNTPIKAFDTLLKKVNTWLLRVWRGIHIAYSRITNVCARPTTIEQKVHWNDETTVTQLHALLIRMQYSVTTFRRQQMLLLCDLAFDNYHFHQLLWDHFPTVITPFSYPFSICFFTVLILFLYSATAIWKPSRVHLKRTMEWQWKCLFCLLL